MILDQDGEVWGSLPSVSDVSNGRVWNGMDSTGRPVPDEAYVLVEAMPDGALGAQARVVSGGEAGDIKEARFDREAGTIVYSLPKASRVLVRLGIKGGPMLKTLVDWKPRVAGSITEHWDGKDEDKVLNLWGAKDLTALITYVTLPDNTVITYGNTNETYREYKLGRGKDRPKVEWAASTNAPAGGGVRPVGLVPPAWARAPKVLMSFPSSGGATNAPIVVSGTTTVRVDVDPSDKDYVMKDQFEVIFFVDNVFFSEAERGYLPFNFRWETDSLPEGEHVLTVNLSSFKGQVGVGSRRVKVVKSGATGVPPK